MKLRIAFLGLVAASASAYADRDSDSHKQELDALERNVPAEKPAPGRDTAKGGPPAWCSELKLGPQGGYSIGSVGRTFDSGKKYDNSWPEIMQAAGLACYWANEPQVQRVAQTIEQHWINFTGLSQADAELSIRAHQHPDALEAEKKKLCDSLQVSDETGGEDKAFTRARRELFGCSDPVAMWATDARLEHDVPVFLDQSEGAPDELAELAFVVDETRIGFDDSITDDRLARYITDQVDFTRLSDASVKAAADAAFPNNQYARVTVLESLARAHLGIAAVQAAVQKKTADAAWKQLFITAPQAGIAAWAQAAATHKDAIARSNAFEHAFFGPSRKAAAGCWEPLRKDFLEVAKKLKHGTPAELQGELGDPVASLLFHRLVACSTVGDVDPNYSKLLLARVRDVRPSRGPRMAAYYAAVDALGAIRDDRRNFPLTAQQLPQPYDSGLIDKAFHDATSPEEYTKRTGKKIDFMGFAGDSGKAIVKSMKKGADGYAVAFVTEKHQEYPLDCKDTNQINQIRPDGSLQYRQNCKAMPPITVDGTVHPVVIPLEWADGLAVGAAIELEAERGKNPRAFPKLIYSDKTKKKLVAWYGFGLQ